MRCENCGASPSSEDLARGECPYCGRAFPLRPAFAPAPPPAPTYFVPAPTPRPARPNAAVVSLVAGLLVAGIGGVLLFAGASSRSAPSSPAYSSPVSSAPGVHPVVSDHEPTPPELPPRSPVPVPASKASAAVPQPRAASPSKPAYVPVTVSVNRLDSGMLQASSLVSFVAPVRACFTKPSTSITLALLFTADGRLGQTSLGPSDANVPVDCVRAKLDALQGTGPAGYVGGRASSASVRIGT